MNELEMANKLLTLAQEVMVLARNSAVVNFRFLDCAVSMLDLQPYGGSLATDGRYLYYEPVYILKAYKTEAGRPSRWFLHLLMHCIFRHWYVNGLVNTELWDISCDIAVENILSELHVDSVDPQSVFMQKNKINELKQKINILTAEKIYDYFLNTPPSLQELDELHKLFSPDEHSLWYQPFQDDGSSDSDGSGDSDSDGDSDGSGDGGRQKDSVSGSSDQTEDDDSGEDGSGSESADDFEDRLEEWKKIAENVQTDLETFSQKQGYGAGSLLQNLAAVNREKYDYGEFLKKFAELHEAMKINDDEFDYNFYTYGLSLYKNMPLIEPLEYKDEKRIREFVIAIDTSGSVQGPLVQNFLNKTYNILKQTESFHSKVNIHIIQCDSEIQDDVKITCQKDLDRYLAEMKLRGFGGTDFRPVFDYVDQLIRNKEFTNLKGLVYFTDGYGIFPSKQPQYNTAFVFIEDDYEIPEVPVWAIKLILQSKEVMDL